MTEEHTPAVCVLVWSTDNHTMASPCCCRCILFCLGNIIVFRHFCIVVFVLLFVVDFFCKWMFILLLTEGKKKLNKLFICFVTCFSVDGMFGENNCECTIKNYSLWICLNSSMLFRKCHLLFNAWLHGLMASTLILKVGSFLAKTLSLDNCHQIQR